LKQALTSEDHETWVEDEVANTLNTFDLGDVRTTQAVVQPVAFAQNQVGEIRTNPVMGTLNTNSNATGRNTPLVMAPASQPVAFNVYPTSGQGAELQACQTNVANAVTVTEHAKSTDRGTRIVQQSPMVVRRLTPLECERLQGFPDGWTDVPFRGKPAADGPRYKALGNSMAVPVMRWIGQRIRNA
jgi:DNA (cytosine-5)-methyltransferase 1